MTTERISDRPGFEDRRTLGTAAVTSAMVVFGVNNVVVRTTNLTSVVTASYRLAIGTVLLVVILMAAKRPPSLVGLRAALLPGIAYGASVLFFFSAFKSTSIANATLIAALQSALSLTVAGRFFGERVGVTESMLTVVATGGVAMVIFGAEVGSGSGALTGDLLAVGGMLANTAYFVLSKRSRETSKVGTGDFQVGLLVVAFVLTIPLLLLGNAPPVPDGGDVLRLLVLAVGGTGGHFALNWAHRHVTLTVASLLVLATPIISSTVAWIVLHERLGPLQWAGAFITLAALTLIIVRTVRPNPVEPVD